MTSYVLSFVCLNNIIRFEQPVHVKEGLKEDNIGNKLLQVCCIYTVTRLYYAVYLHVLFSSNFHRQWAGMKARGWENQIKESPNLSRCVYNDTAVRVFDTQWDL